MRVKLQPPTKVEMAAYNPIQPPASISQVMLLANPSKVCSSLSLSEYIHVHSIQSYTHPSDRFRQLRYRISYNQGGQEVAEMGEAADFNFHLNFEWATRDTRDYGNNIIMTHYSCVCDVTLLLCIYLAIVLVIGFHL